MHILEQEPYFSDLDCRISNEEIDKALKRLNKTASPGIDRVSGKHILLAKETLKPLLNLFYNKLFSFSKHPVIFSLNFLKSIFKKGDTWDPENYRGIAIGSAIAKLFKLIILDRLENHIQKSYPISQNQIGFKK